MGIVNATPDSFYNRQPSFESALDHAYSLVERGADILDIGGESTRPGYTPVSLEEELNRVLQLIDELAYNLPCTPLSIDTTKPQVARAALRAGATIVNDVSGTFDPLMQEVLREHPCARLILTYNSHCEENDYLKDEPLVLNTIRNRCSGFFIERSVELDDQGINVGFYDPGFGFGKTPQENLRLLYGCQDISKISPFPMVLGVSHKSFKHKNKHCSQHDILKLCCQIERPILRVHDPQEVTCMIRDAHNLYIP